MNPDPSICRVGADFYLVTSSFEYFPGVPIFHSRDLVNWTQIGHVLTRERQLNLAGVYSSGGIYAPTLRHHAGRFYMITTLVGSPKHGGNFYVTADDPRGPWSDPIWIDSERLRSVAAVRGRRGLLPARRQGPDQRSPARLPGAHRSGDGRAARADAGDLGRAPAASGRRARTSTR